MKFALSVPALLNYPATVAPWEPDASGKDVIRFAQAADKQSWDWLTIPEHILMTAEMSEVMGRRFPEGIAACAVLAGATERVHLLTYVLVLPYRNPLLLAKQIATMDFIAGGRFTLGTAPGHLEGEFDALGVPFHKRGRITDEYLEVLVECWTSELCSYDGEYASFKDVIIDPKPVQKPYPPIYIGGNTEVAMKRAVKYGDGWIPWLITAEQLAGCIEFLKAQPGFEEKEADFEIIMPATTFNIEDYSHKETGKTDIHMDRDEILQDIEALAKAGATAAQVMTPRVDSFQQCLEWVEWFDSEIIPVFR